MEAAPRPVRTRTQQSLELLTNKIRETQSNVEFLMQVQKTTLGAKSDNDK